MQWKVNCCAESVRKNKNLENHNDGRLCEMALLRVATDVDLECEPLPVQGKCSRKGDICDVGFGEQALLMSKGDRVKGWEGKDQSRLDCEFQQRSKGRRQGGQIRVLAAGIDTD